MQASRTMKPVAHHCLVGMGFAFAQPILRKDIVQA